MYPINDAVQLPCILTECICLDFTSVTSARIDFCLCEFLSCDADEMRIRNVEALGQQEMLIKGFCLGNIWYSLSSLQSVGIL